MDLRQVLTAFRRWRYLMITLIVLCLAGAGALAATTARTYAASTTVFFSLNNAPRSTATLAQTSTYTQEMVKTYSQVVTLSIVLDPTISELGLDVSPADLARRISVQTQPDTVLATITVTDATAEGSAKIADTVATELGDAVLTLSGGNSGASAVRVSTISAARVPSSPASPNIPRLLILGLAAGLLLAVASAVVLNLITSRPVDDEALIEAGPLLGQIVFDPRARSRPLPISTRPGEPVAENYRALRTNLRRIEDDEGVKCLVVVSANAKEGRTSVASNLAVAAAQTYRKVLLIDGDLRRAALSAQLGMGLEPGLANLLSSSEPQDNLIKTWRTETWRNWNKLDVLPSGMRVPDPSELFAQTMMTDLLEQARKQYDLIIIDSPPLLPVTDAALLASLADGALLVAHARRTNIREFEEAQSTLRLAGAKVQGVVLIGVRRRLRIVEATDPAHA